MKREKGIIERKITIKKLGGPEKKRKRRLREGMRRE